MATCENCWKAFEAGYGEAEKAYLATIESRDADSGTRTGGTGMTNAPLKIIQRHDVYRLESTHKDQPEWADKYVVVVLLADRVDPDGPLNSIRSWTGLVIGGNHPRYPVRGYEIVVSNADILLRGTRLEL